jgi:hypothetical protein
LRIPCKKVFWRHPEAGNVEILKKKGKLLAKTEKMFYNIDIIKLIQGCLGVSESF